MTRTEEAAGYMMTMASFPLTRDEHHRALAAVLAMHLSEQETVAAVAVARDWFALATRLAAAVDDWPPCPDCGYTADHTTPCLCPPRPRGDVPDTLPF